MPLMAAFLSVFYALQTLRFLEIVASYTREASRCRERADPRKIRQISDGRPSQNQSEIQRICWQMV